jgi:hypothetical protein
VGSFKFPNRRPPIPTLTSGCDLTQRPPAAVPASRTRLSRRIVLKSREFWLHSIRPQLCAFVPDVIGVIPGLALHAEIGFRAKLFGWLRGNATISNCYFSRSLSVALRRQVSTQLWQKRSLKEVRNSKACESVVRRFTLATHIGRSSHARKSSNPLTERNVARSCVPNRSRLVGYFHTPNSLLRIAGRRDRAEIIVRRSVRLSRLKFLKRGHRAHTARAPHSFSRLG